MSRYAFLPEIAEATPYSVSYVRDILERPERYSLRTRSAIPPNVKKVGGRWAMLRSHLMKWILLQERRMQR